jgi:Tol biopolymer transport system component
MEGSIMRKVFRFGIGVTLACSLMLAQSSRTEVEFKAAQHKEEVVGDFEGAIKQYKKIADGRDRAFAVKALLRMAALHQKLGDAEAQKIYERIARNFGDQKEAAAEARTRLASLKPTSVSNEGMRTRLVWSGNAFGIGTSVSPDGRSFIYGKGFVSDFVLRDLVSGTDRPLTNASDIVNSFSRDGKMLAYMSCDNGKAHCGLRLANVQDSSQFKTLYDNPDVSFVLPHDWTPDNKFLAVSLRRKDQTAQIGLVSTESGELRVLKSVDWRLPTRIFISPDGKYLAFDLPASDATAQRDISVLTLDGSSEKAVVVDEANDVIMGWSPDGQYLVFASERTAPSISLWALRFAGGQPPGKPEILKRDFGPVESMGVTASGALYFKVSTPVTTKLQVGSFDFNSEQFGSPKSVPVVGLAGSNSGPDWSPDGQHLVYRSARTGAGGTQDFRLVIHSLESGQVRELQPTLSYAPSNATWSPDGKSLLLDGRDFKGRWGIYKIDAQTGETTAIVNGELCEAENCFNPAWSPDGKSIFYLQGVPGGNDVVVRELSSGTVTKLFHNDSSTLHRPVPSPDGRYVAVRRGLVVHLIPATGGPSRELISGSVIAWAPDSRSLLIGSMQQSVWRVSLEGEARKIETGIPSGFSVHPDGRRIAFTARDEQSGKRPEIWALENFLPNPRASGIQGQTTRTPN